MARHHRRFARTLAFALGLGALLLPGAAANAATAKATYVAIVISGHGAGCVKWFSGITGDYVLNQVAAVTYRRDGIIVQIDGEPSSGTADNTHYWSYWHDTASGWQYSGSGASGYQPAAGTVEGWSYVNGSTTAHPPSQNPSGLYASICGSKDPQPAPTTAQHSTPPAPGTTTTPAQRAASSIVPAPQRGVTTASASVRASGSSRATKPRARPATSSSRSAAAARPTGSSPATAAPVLTPLPKPVAQSSSGSAAPALIGIGLVALIGSGGGWAAWRRRGTT